MQSVYSTYRVDLFEWGRLGSFALVWQELKSFKAWTAIDRLTTMWISDLYDKLKGKFFQEVAVLVLLYGSITWTLIKRLEKKLELLKDAVCCLEQILEEELYGHLHPI